MHRSVIGLFALAAVCAGCSKDPPGTLVVNTGHGNSGTGAKAFFVDQVFPLLSVDQGTDDAGKLRRACTDCHATGENDAPLWLTKDAATSYSQLEDYQSPYGSALIAAPANSELLLHGEHTGPALTQTQQLLVTDWLELEVSERQLVDPGGGEGGASGGTGGGTPVATMTVDQALKEWGACMSYTDWVEQGMDKLPSSQTVGSGSCNGCHSTGQAGSFLSDNPQDTFEENRKKPYMLKLVIGKVGSNGGFLDLVPASRFINKGTEECTLDDKTLCHPVYALETSTTDAIEGFFTATYDRWKTGNCEGGGTGGAGGEGGAGGAGGGN